MDTYVLYLHNSDALVIQSSPRVEIHSIHFPCLKSNQITDGLKSRWNTTATPFNYPNLFTDS